MPVTFTEDDFAAPHTFTDNDFAESREFSEADFASSDEPYDSPGVPDDLPARERKRLELLSEMAAEKDNERIIDKKLRGFDFLEGGLVSPQTAESILSSASGPGVAELAPGVTRSVSKMASGLTSPINLSMLAAGGGAASIPNIGGAVARGIAGGFGVDMATHIPELAQRAGEVSVTGTPEERQEAYTDLALTGGMAALATRGAIGDVRPTRIPEPPLDIRASVFERAAPEPPIDIQASVRTEPPIVRAAETSGAKAGLNESVKALQETKGADAQKGLNEKVERPIQEPEQSAVARTADDSRNLQPASEAGTQQVEVQRLDSGGTVKESSVAEQVATDPIRPAMKLAAEATPEALKTELASVEKQLSGMGKPSPELMAELQKLPVPERIAEIQRRSSAKDVLAQRAYVLQEAMRHQAEGVKAPEPIKAVEPVGAESTGTTPETAGAGATLGNTPAPAAPALSARPAGEFKTGDRVLTEEYGRGQVTAVLPSRVIVKFDNDSGSAFGVKKGSVKLETPEPALAESGMGGMKPGERLKSPLAGVEDSLKTLAQEAKPSVAKAFDLGEAGAKLKDRVSNAVQGLQTAAQYLKKKQEGKPEWNSWKDALGDRHLALSESAVNARKFVKTAQKALPDKVDREAISNWVDTGGDATLLTKGATESPSRYKAGYERAAKLTPDQKVVAENLREYFEKRLEDAQEAGILEDGIENYLHRIYEKDSDFKKSAIAELRSGLFTGKPSLAKQRVFEYDMDAEKAGLRPIKDFVQRVAQYDLALNKAIADRTAVKAMMEIKMPDGRPMIDVGGGGKTIEAPTGETQATLINRSAKKFDENDPKANRGDFKSFDHPALRKWKWVMNDAQGKPVFVQGDVLIHPDAMPQLEKLLGRSRIRQNPIGRGALNVSSTVKQTMLDLSGFHQVQIGVHGFEHKTFKPVKEIDFTDPDVRGLIKGGAVVGETSGNHLFSEGLSGSSLTKHIPIVGEWVQRYQSYLFEDYIPRLKVAMGLHALGRNAARFPALSKPELYHLTANQMNAAFGELNYEMMGRSKTMQDALRLTLLAPDFLEARTRFTGQGATKYGTEQRNALLLGAATMYVTARIMNKLLDDEYHFEPKNAFNIVYKGKSYGLRTVQGDLIHAATDPGKFANHRLNPLYGKPVLEVLTGRDYFGRKRDLADKVKDIASTPVPISIRGLFSGREQNLMESFLNSFGFVTKRNSPSSEIAKLANDWREKNKVRPEPGEFIYDADKDPYRQIKLAADYYDEAAVRSEIAKAVNDGITKQKIREHFKLSASRPFTGSKVNEQKFLKSLSKDEMDAYRKAKLEREKIRDTVNSALR